VVCCSILYELNMQCLLVLALTIDLVFTPLTSDCMVCFKYNIILFHSLKFDHITMHGNGVDGL
jgi:hypothetical protein